MIIKNEQPAFAPITITIETPAELDILQSAFIALSTSGEDVTDYTRRGTDDRHARELVERLRNSLDEACGQVFAL